MDQGLSVPGVTNDELLSTYRAKTGNPSATVDDMFTTVMALGPSPAAAAPPVAAPSSVKGSQSSTYALADHTHGERCKWAGTAQVSNTSGAWTKTLPANLLVQSPSVGITPRMATGTYTWRISITGTAAAGFTCTVNFAKQKESIAVAVLGTYATIEAGTAIGAVTFDIQFFEPDQVGN